MGEIKKTVDTVNCEKRLQAAETLLEKIFAGYHPCGILPEYMEWMIAKSGWYEVGDVQTSILELLVAWVDFGNGHTFAPPQIETETLLKNLGVAFKEPRK